MIRREISPPMRIILRPQIIPISPHMIRRIQTRPLRGCKIPRRPVRQMASKNQHVPSLQRDGHPSLCILPSFRNVSAVRKLDVHFVRARDDLQTSVLRRRSVNGDVGGDVLDAADVVVSWGVEVCLEAISEGEFVVYLIFKKKHFLCVSTTG